MTGAYHAPCVAGVPFGKRCGSFRVPGSTSEPGSRLRRARVGAPARQKKSPKLGEEPKARADSCLRAVRSSVQLFAETFAALRDRAHHHLARGHRLQVVPDAHARLDALVDV